MVDDNNVYACVGQPQPKEIDRILHILLDGSFDSAYDSLNTIRLHQGIALTDVIESLLDHVMKLNLDETMLCPLIDQMSKIQARMGQGCSEKIQLLCLISAFALLRRDAFQADTSMDIDG